MYYILENFNLSRGSKILLFTISQIFIFKKPIESSLLLIKILFYKLKNYEISDYKF